MSVFIHGDNIETKLNQVKAGDNLSHLKEIKTAYQAWRAKIDLLKGKRRSADIKKLVDALNEYKDFIDQPKFRKEKGNLNGFTSQSKLHSTVLEEFMYHLLIEIPQLSGKHLEFGATHAYSNLYFSPASLDSFETKTGLSINTKDQDFAISKKVHLATSLPPNDVKEQHVIHVPVVLIECKTYLDKTMYEGSVATAENIKRGNPYSLFLIVTETYEVPSTVDPIYSEIDQIYVLRKQRKREDKQSIQADIVENLFEEVAAHMSPTLHDLDKKIKAGKLI